MVYTLYVFKSYIFSFMIQPVHTHSYCVSIVFYDFIQKKIINAVNFK